MPAAAMSSTGLTFAIASPPAHGTLSGTAPNLTYTPAQDYNGPDSFTFTVNDGSLTSAVATVSITVTPVNDAPVAVDDAYNLFKNTTLTIPGRRGTSSFERHADFDAM